MHTYFNTVQIILNWLWCRIKINLVRKEGRTKLHILTKPSVEMLKLEHSYDRELSCSLNWILRKSDRSSSFFFFGLIFPQSLYLLPVIFFFPFYCEGPLPPVLCWIAVVVESIPAFLILNGIHRNFLH